MNIANSINTETTGLSFFRETLASKFVLALMASGFVAACAHLSVRLPMTPIPLTLGNMAVVLVGLALGPAMGFTAMLFYLIEGSIGLPVFNPGGPGGILQLMGPSGGFLFSYPFAAAAAGALSRLFTESKSRFKAAVFGASIATILTLSTGVIWLGALAHLSTSMAFKLGVAPFLPGELVKVLSAAGIFTSLDRWRRI